MILFRHNNVFSGIIRFSLILTCIVFSTNTSAEFPKRERLPMPQDKIEPIEPIQVPEDGLQAPETLSTGIRVFIKDFKFTGNTVISNDDLSSLLLDFKNRGLTTTDLIHARTRVTKAYINRGYINSGAVIQDQEVKDGVIVITVIEGRLSDVQLNGLEWLNDSYVLDRVALDTGPPFNIIDLQQRLQMLNQNPLIKQIKADLLPGTEPGDGRLLIEAIEEKPYSISLGFNNHRSPSVGAEQLQLDLQHLNLTGHGDAAMMQLDKTEGLEEISLFYSLPLTAKDVSFEMAYDRINAHVVEEPFSLVDVDSKFESARISLNIPHYQNLNGSLIYGITLERRYSSTFLFDIPFSFAEGVVDGESTTTAIRLSQNWFMSKRDDVYAINSRFSFGVDALDATINETLPDGQFVSWLGQFQWVHRMNKPFSMAIARLDTQLSGDKLLPLEKFAIGGVNSVRGYRENLLVTDNGVVLSLEYRLPLLTSSDYVNTLQLAPFIDYGRGWDTDSALSPVNIYSVGFGFLWQPVSNLDVEIYYGQQLKNVDIGAVESDLQDEGIHFMIRYGLI